MGAAALVELRLEGTLPVDPRRIRRIRKTNPPPKNKTPHADLQQKYKKVDPPQK